MVYEPYRQARRRSPVPTDKYALWRKTALQLGLSREAKQRLEWIIFYYTSAQENGALVCRHFALHRNTFSKWLRRFNEANLRSLESGDRTPHTTRQRVADPFLDGRVIALRKQYPCWGKMKLKTLYPQQYGAPISAWYVQRVIETYGLYPDKRAKTVKQEKNAQKKKKITELTNKEPRTGFLLHFDSIVLHLEGLKRYIITSIDHHSRLGYARMYTSHSSQSATDFLKRMRYLLETNIENIHTDNGSEFHKHFAQAVTALNLTHYWSRPRTPKDNPALERFNGTLKHEFLRQGNFHSDPAIFNQRLTDWLITYNSVRPHQALGYLTPLKFAEQSMGLHTMWSSRTLP
jgi:transposase InsO family protein